MQPCVVPGLLQAPGLVALVELFLAVPVPRDHGGMPSHVHLWVPMGA